MKLLMCAIFTSLLHVHTPLKAQEKQLSQFDECYGYCREMLLGDPFVCYVNCALDPETEERPTPHP